MTKNAFENFKNQLREAEVKADASLQLRRIRRRKLASSRRKLEMQTPEAIAKAKAQRQLAEEIHYERTSRQKALEKLAQQGRMATPAAPQRRSKQPRKRQECKEKTSTRQRLVDLHKGKPITQVFGTKGKAE